MVNRKQKNVFSNTLFNNNYQSYHNKSKYTHQLKDRLSVWIKKKNSVHHMLLI